MADFDSSVESVRRQPGINAPNVVRRLSGRGRQALTALVAVAALAGFAAIVLYSYDRGRQAGMDGIAPVIQASEGPTRVRPAEPGGMVVPDRDKQVFSRINPSESPPRVERLLSPPETTVERPAPLANLEPPPRMDDATLRALGAEPAAGPGAVENLIPTSRAAPRKPGRSRSAAPAEAMTAATTPGPAKTTASAPPSPPPAVSSAPASAAPAARKPAGGPGWRVQIAAFRSEAAAEQSWAKLKGQHPDLFSDLELSVARADLGPRKGIYYRMRAGPLADRAAAADLCKRFKQRKLGCFVVRP